MKKILFILSIILSFGAKSQTTYILEGTLTFASTSFNPILINSSSVHDVSAPYQTSTFNISAHSTVLAFIRYTDDGVPHDIGTVSDGTNSYSRIAITSSATNITYEELWYCKDATAVTGATLNFTPSGGTIGNVWLGHAQYTGLSLTAPVDVFATGVVTGGTATSLTTGTFTTTTANQLLFVVCSVDATGDVIGVNTSGYSLVVQDTPDHVINAFSKTVSSIQTGADVTFTSNNSRHWTGIVVTLK